MSYGKIKAFNDPALTAFMPGNGKNTILRLAANALGIPLQEEGQPAQQQQAFGGMPEWAGNLNPSSNIAPVKPPQTEPQQYAQYGGWGYNQQPPVAYNSYDEMKMSKDKLTPEQYMVYRGIMNLPPEPQRPFEADFPNKDYKADPETGRMMTDVDGRPINPNAVIVGHAYENQGDSALSDQDVNKIIENFTGYSVFQRSPKTLEGQGYLSGYLPKVHEDGIGFVFVDPKIVNEDKRLENPSIVFPEISSRALKHELAHMFDHVMGTKNDSYDSLPGDVIEEFNKIYNESRNPNLGFERLRNPQAKPEDDVSFRGWIPESDGYYGENAKYIGKRDQRREELFAEALRAYLTDPNAMKTRFPKAAKYLRDHINNNPYLNKYIHLSDNSGNMDDNPYFSLLKQNKNV